MDEQAKVGVVGVGFIGQLHARTVAESDGAELAAVIDLARHAGQGWSPSATARATFPTSTGRCSAGGHRRLHRRACPTRCTRRRPAGCSSSAARCSSRSPWPTRWPPPRRWRRPRRRAAAGCWSPTSCGSIPRYVQAAGRGTPRQDRPARSMARAAASPSATSASGSTARRAPASISASMTSTPCNGSPAPTSPASIRAPSPS